MAYIEGTDRRDVLNGTVGSDTILGGDGRDKLNGAEGADDLRGGDGNDTLRGGPGDDSYDGGNGNDLFMVSQGASDDYVQTSRGNDIIDLSGATEEAGLLISYQGIVDFVPPFSIFVQSIEATIRNNGATVVKSLSDGASETDTLRGIGNLGDRSVPEFSSPGLGFIGSDGDDLIEFDRDSGPMVSFIGSGGDDTIIGSESGVERLRLQNAIDANGTRIGMTVEINSSPGGQMSGSADLADSGTSDSASYLFSGIDVISGSFGNDLVIGSAGRDWFQPGSGNDGFDGKKGFDTVDYNHTNWLEGLIVDLAGGTASFRSTSVNSSYEDGLKSVEAAIGNRLSDDILKGSAVGNMLSGLGGDDLLVGRGGRDTLIGGEGDDTLNGGVGRDVFVFGEDDGDDRLRRYEDGKDKLQIDVVGLSFADVEITDLGRHALVTFADSSVKLLNTDHEVLGAGDFLFIG